jgi:cobalamin biosynthetic protein CobC
MREVSYAGLGQALHDSDVMVVCNPNNPTGDMVTPERLLIWADALAARGGWLIIDEAFVDMTPEHSVARYCGRPGLIVLRSIGKFFGLAGLRLGFVAAAERTLADLAELLGPWAVSGPAQVIGEAALSDTAWQRETRRNLSEASARLRGVLQRYGIASCGCALFEWWPEPAAEAFQLHMTARGIWVRRFAQTGPSIRLGLPRGDAGFERLDRALAEWKKESR